MTRVETLVLIHQGENVLLAMKKQRFGKGKYNGFGGGVEDGESHVECAIRETHEEGGIKIKNPNYVGRLLFKFLDSDEQDHEVHFYKVVEYDGEPKETEEMNPTWFHQDEIPYEEMWADDKHWMPLFLAGKKFVGEFHFEGKGIAYHELNEVKEL